MQEIKITDIANGGAANGGSYARKLVTGISGGVFC